MLTACHSSTDLDEAERAGAHAVSLATGGVTGAMVTLLRESNDPYTCGMGHVPLERVANRVRVMPSEYLAPNNEGITEAFRTYAEPLMGGALIQYPRLAQRFVNIPA